MLRWRTLTSSALRYVQPFMKCYYSAAVRSKAVMLLLFIHCHFVLGLWLLVGFLLYIILLMKKRDLVLCLFFMVPWVGMQSVIMAFSDLTCFLRNSEYTDEIPQNLASHQGLMFDLILYVLSTIFQLNRYGSS